VFLAAAMALLLTSRPGNALAGPVRVQSAGVTVRYQDTFNGEDRMHFPVTFPGSALVEYHGTALDPQAPGIGDDRGTAGANYNLQDLPDGASFAVSVFHDNRGEEQRTLGGDVEFAMSFTTDRSLHYVFSANPNGPSADFVANFAGVTQDLHVSEMGDVTGSLLDDMGAPISRTVEGDLPAGMHSLSVLVNVVNGQLISGASGNGSVEIALSAADGNPTPIPLPPAVWSGLIGLIGLITLARATGTLAARQAA
jgi:hypothetical protein